MKLLQMTLNYFMSFGPSNTVKLDGRGLTLINGVNEISDTASSNGAGKTNLQEALPWVLFGKTTKGVDVNDVVNNIHKKDCYVEAEFEDGTDTYHIIRYRNHSDHGDDLLFFKINDEGEKENLAGVDKAETQQRIEKFIGSGFTLFCNSTYFSQNNVKPFSTFTDKQLKEVFIEALDMGRFTQALEKTRLDLKTLREEQATLQGRKIRLEEEVSEAQTRQRDYQLKHDAFDTTRAADLEKFDESIAKVEAKLETLRGAKTKDPEIRSAMEAHQKTLENLPEILKNKTSIEEAASRFSDSYKLLYHKSKELERLLDTKTWELNSASRRVGTNCSECGKPITEDDLAEVIASMKVQIEVTTAEIEKYQSLIGRAQPKLKEFEYQKAGVHDQVTVCQDAQNQITALKIQLARIESIKAEITMLEGQIRDLKAAKLGRASETSPWRPYIDKEQATIDDALMKIKGLEGVIAEKQLEIQYVEYWENAFGYSGIPSFLLDSVTPVLNEQANHHSTTVTGGEIEINFSTVTKTKTGTSKDKFAINISHKNGAKKYKGISGGERKRADVCIAQSIQDLVRSYGRNTLSYCSYDEPFENLDSEGVANVIEMLNEVSKEVGTVLVVTHNSELKAMFDSTITVVKGKDGYSRIIA